MAEITSILNQEDKWVEPLELYLYKNSWAPLYIAPGAAQRLEDFISLFASEDEQRLFLRYYRDGMTLREIANREIWAPSTIQGKIRNVVRVLREITATWYVIYHVIGNAPLPDAPNMVHVLAWLKDHPGALRQPQSRAQMRELISILPQTTAMLRTYMLFGPRYKEKISMYLTDEAVESIISDSSLAPCDSIAMFLDEHSELLYRKGGVDSSEFFDVYHSWLLKENRPEKILCYPLNWFYFEDKIRVEIKRGYPDVKETENRFFLWTAEGVDDRITMFLRQYRELFLREGGIHKYDLFRLYRDWCSKNNYWRHLRTDFLDMVDKRIKEQMPYISLRMDGFYCCSEKYGGKRQKNKLFSYQN